MDNIDEKLLQIARDCPLIPDTSAGMLMSSVRRMKAERAAGIPVSRRTGFAISIEHGRSANNLPESEWEEFYSGLCAELNARYPELYSSIFADR